MNFQTLPFLAELCHLLSVSVSIPFIDTPRRQITDYNTITDGNEYTAIATASSARCQRLWYLDDLIDYKRLLDWLRRRILHDILNEYISP